MDNDNTYDEIDLQNYIITIDAESDVYNTYIVNYNGEIFSHTFSIYVGGGMVGIEMSLDELIVQDMMRF